LEQSFKFPAFLGITVILNEELILFYLILFKLVISSRDVTLVNASITHRYTCPHTHQQNNSPFKILRPCFCLCHYNHCSFTYTCA